MSAFEVVWDGTRERPGGPYLAVQADAPVEAPVSTRAVRRQAQAAILAVLREGPATMHEVAGIAQLDLVTVNSALWWLRRRGEVVVQQLKPLPAARQCFGRTEEAVYAVPDRAG